MAKTKPKLTGRWSITSMDQLDDSYINEEVPGFFEFGKQDMGSFHFGYIQGDVNYRLTERDGLPAVEFSWAGYDAGGDSECSGRGWMVLEGDTLTGRFFFHSGDESGIVLQRAAETRKRRKG